MHELSLLTAMMDVVHQRARDVNATRVHRVRLRIGQLSGVVPQALQLGFEVVTRDTIAEGATLECIDVPPRCKCPACGDIYQPDDFIFCCPRCDALSSELLEGNELLLDSLEVS